MGGSQWSVCKVEGSWNGYDYLKEFLVINYKEKNHFGGRKRSKKSVRLLVSQTYIRD